MPVRIANAPTFAIPPANPALGRSAHDIPCIGQEQVNWCWAACIQMVLSRAKAIAQCDIVNAGLGRTICCNPGSAAGPLCNTPIPGTGPESIEATLHRLGAPGTYVASALTPSQLLREVARAPVMALYDRGGVAGHVVLVIGATPSPAGNPMLLINNPGPRTAAVVQAPYDELRGGLGLGVGLWTGTVQGL